MEGKKILIVLVIVAAAVTGYVLVQDAKTNMDSSQEIVKVPAKVSLETKSSAQATKANMDSASQESTNPVSSQPAEAQPASSEPASAANPTNSNDKKMKLEIKTTQAGSGDRTVKSGDTISVQYTGKLTDGTVFDATSKHGGTPFDFTIGQGQVIKGWDQGLLGMKVGEKRTITIPADLGYGATGAGSSIPPNSTLIFDVELVSIK
ncbi:MAG: FKBP-type peptidyl-prolyl cis-trans isomerase [Candidatus Moraniibacteriota bacterium]